MKSILTASQEELESIVQLNTIPEHIDLTGLEERKDFQKLFSHRINPRFIAQTLLKEKELSKKIEEDNPLKVKRLQIREKELELKEKKLTKTSAQLTGIWEAIGRLETKIDLILYNQQKETFKNFSVSSAEILSKEGGEN